MSVSLLIGTYDGHREACVLVDSVTGLAFGPMFTDELEAEAFLSALRKVGKDARQILDIAGAVHQWRSEGTIRTSMRPPFESDEEVQ